MLLESLGNMFIYEKLEGAEILWNLFSTKWMLKASYRYFVTNFIANSEILQFGSFPFYDKLMINIIKLIFHLKSS